MFHSNDRNRLASNYVNTLRKESVNEGRAMIRVRYNDTGELSTAAVCPACWNDPERRRAILARLHKMEAEVLSDKDRLDGSYLPGKRHLSNCPYRKREDAWERFRRQMSSSG